MAWPGRAGSTGTRGRPLTWHDIWLEALLLPAEVRHLQGPRQVRLGRDEAIVLCLVKDAGYHIGPFIAHYRKLGVGHIVLLDNGSTDDTLAQASGQVDVSVFQTRLPFRNNNRQMRRYLVRRFTARDRWALVVDADELFDFPCSDRIGLPAMLAYLRSRGFTTMVSYLLDMLPDRPLSQVDAHLPMQQACPHYDLSAVRKRGYFEVDGYGGERWVAHNRLANPEVQRYVGGVRAQAFDLREVYLIKHPLHLRDGRASLVHQHFVDHAHVADISGVLCHYKFTPGFRARVDSAVRSGAYADGSWEYRRYQQALDREPDMALCRATAQTLHSVNDLVANGFLQVTDDYLDWVEKAST